jgi:hypothetical protein
VEGVKIGNVEKIMCGRNSAKLEADILLNLDVMTAATLRFGDIYEIGIVDQVLKGAESRISPAKVTVKKGTFFAKLSYSKTKAVLGSYEEKIAHKYVTKEGRLRAFRIKEYFISEKHGKEYKGQ